MPNVPILNKRTIASLDLNDAENYFLAYLDTQCNINSSDQTIIDIYEGKHKYIDQNYCIKNVLLVLMELVSLVTVIFVFVLKT